MFRSQMVWEDTSTASFNRWGNQGMQRTGNFLGMEVISKILALSFPHEPQWLSLLLSFTPDTLART